MYKRKKRQGGLRSLSYIVALFCIQNISVSPKHPEFSYSQFMF